MDKGFKDIKLNSGDKIKYRGWTLEVQFDQLDMMEFYAFEELLSLLYQVKQFQDNKELTKQCTFKFKVDSNLQPYSFSIVCNDKFEKGIMVELIGYNNSALLQAVYRMLEMLGFSFDIIDTIIPKKVNFEDLIGVDKIICPAVSIRGIRQHINFPMDISSYPLKEAKEYIQNLARLGFNHITFHSYPEQWYHYEVSDEKMLAGKFFYNETHSIPNYSVVKANVRNQQVFCIPEIEPIFDDQEQRSNAAVHWLQEVMKEAKKVGMTVQLSIELRDKSLDDSMSICNQVLNLYPMIDFFELMTQECGGWGSKSLSVQELKKLLEQEFGKGILYENNIISQLKDDLWQLPVTINELSRNIKVIVLLEEQLKAKFINPVMGIYATDPDTLKIVRSIMKKYVPKHVGFCFLPAHGAVVTAQNLESIEFTSKDWKRSMIYSWIEFDGSMYLQQNAINGIEHMLNYAKEQMVDEPIPAISFNHWRTAENQIVFKYLSHALLFGDISRDEFYRNYAVQLQIEQEDIFIQVMKQLEQVDNRVRCELGNIGFCYLGCWINEGLGYIGKWDKNVIDAVRKEYEAIYEKIHTCLATVFSDYGKTCLSLLSNRINCTILHLKGISKLTELQPICEHKKQQDLNDEQRKKVMEICKQATEFINEYMIVHADELPDRGCEGTLISYHYTLPSVISILESKYGESKNKIVIREDGSDAPPPPAI